MSDGLTLSLYRLCQTVTLMALIVSTSTCCHCHSFLFAVIVATQATQQACLFAVAMCKIGKQVLLPTHTGNCLSVRLIAHQAFAPGTDTSAVSARSARTSASVSRFRPSRRASSKPLKRKVVCRSPLGMWQEPHCQLGPAPVPSCSKHNPQQRLTSCMMAKICSTTILSTLAARKFAARTSCRQGQFKHGLQQHVCQEINLSASYYGQQA